MKSAAISKNQYCPLCGEEVFDTEIYTQEETGIIHYFQCANKTHPLPIMLARYNSSVDDISDWKIYITTDTQQAIMRGRNDYCFLCGSELAEALQYFSDGDNKMYFFYECIQEGHVWCVVDNIQSALFCFISLAVFDKLHLTRYTVSRHHVRIPLRLNKRGLRNLKYEIIEF